MANVEILLRSQRTPQLKSNSLQLLLKLQLSIIDMLLWWGILVT